MAADGIKSRLQTFRVRKIFRDRTHSPADILLDIC